MGSKESSKMLVQYFLEFLETTEPLLIDVMKIAELYISIGNEKCYSSNQQKSFLCLMSTEKKSTGSFESKLPEALTLYSKLLSACSNSEILADKSKEIDNFDSDKASLDQWKSCIIHNMDTLSRYISSLYEKGKAENIEMETIQPTQSSSNHITFIEDHKQDDETTGDEMGSSASQTRTVYRWKRPQKRLVREEFEVSEDFLKYLN